MRILPAVLFLVATISTASAQRASEPDNGNAAGSSAASGAGAAAGSGRAAAAASTKAGGVAAVAPLSASQFTDFHINGGGIIRAAPPQTPEQQKADAEARAAWQARCRPTVVEDREGLRRTQYAERDCDLSRFNTAGTR